MKEPGKIMRNARRGTLIKAFALLAFAAISIGLVEFSSLRSHLKPEQFQRIISEAGLMGAVLLAISCAGGTCLFVPGVVFVGIGAAIFGPFRGFAWVWPGCLAGAAICFLVAHTLGRDYVSSLIGGRLRKYDDLIERNGFNAVLLLRLMFVPFAPLNFGMGLTKVRFWDYFFATSMGEAVTIFVVIFSIGTMKQIYSSGDWGQLFSARMTLSFGLLIATALIVKLAQRKCERRSAPVSGNPSANG
ncbi:MAG: TVP38/TMEM64 family protein [Syntrophobacteraceae bacterium]